MNESLYAEVSVNIWLIHGHPCNRLCIKSNQYMLHSHCTLGFWQNSNNTVFYSKFKSSVIDCHAVNSGQQLESLRSTHVQYTCTCITIIIRFSHITYVPFFLKLDLNLYKRSRLGGHLIRCG